MKYLLPLILACALLCGCGRTDASEETMPTLPTESVAGEASEPEAYGGAVQTIPLNLRKVRGLRIFNGKFLLLSGQGTTTLTLLEKESLEECTSVTLDFQLEQEDASLRLHSDGSLSFFDPVAEETVVLDSTLEEVRRIAAPGALSGTPILSDDGGTLFYCTASHVRAWDLETDIRRCVKEMSFDSQVLTGTAMEDMVLQCRVTESGEGKTLFLSAQDGRLLCQNREDISLYAENGCYYASVPAGTYRAAVFGTDPGSPRMLVPGDMAAKVFFLPGQHSAVAATELQDGRIRLEYFDLNTGLCRFRLTLEPYRMPRSVIPVDGRTVAVLTYDPAQDRDVLTLWQLQEDSAAAVQETWCHVEDYHTADSTDPEGLAACRKQAERLGQRYGIRILLWEDAVAAAPWEYELEPEHLVPVIRQELDLLEQRLAQYPQRVLAETAAHFSGMHLCLVRSLRSADDGGPEVTAGVQFLKGSDAYVVIPTGTFGEQALYHQLFHLMEIHIFSESKAFDRWDALNPAGFGYDYDYAANASRDSGVYLFEENRAFVDTYSMSFPKEDRARIMEYAMLPGNARLFRPAAMQEKLRTLCTGIREAYGLKGYEGDLRWEQYLE